MRSIRFAIVAAVSVALVALPSLALAGGRGMGGGGPGYGRGGMRGGGAGGRRAQRGTGPGVGRAWDRSREITLHGTIIEGPMQTAGRTEAEVSPQGAPGLFAAFLLRTDAKQTRRVRLGPPWYVDSTSLRPVRGDEVEVTGIPWEIRGQTEIIARQVVWRGATYSLRTDDGRPMWAGAASSRWLRFSQLWNPQRRATVTGEIQAVENVFPDGQEMGAGVVIRVRDQQGKVTSTELGPAWFVEEQLPDLKPGQRVTVAGSLVDWDRIQVLMASEIEHNGKRVRIRDESGRPEWPGGWQNWGGWGPGSSYGGLYDTRTVETVTGTVQETERLAPRMGMGHGAVIVVKAQDGREVQAHLGPVWFMRESALQPKVGDEVTLTGSIVTLEGKPVMLVKDITWNGRRYEMRKEDGTPVWVPGRPTPAR